MRRHLQQWGSYNSLFEMTMTTIASREETPFVTTRNGLYEKQISDLGETTDDGDGDSEGGAAVVAPVPSTEDTGDDDDDTGYRMSVEAHLKEDDIWKDEDDDSLELLEEEEEESIRSWRSFRSRRNKGGNKNNNNSNNNSKQNLASPQPRVEIYVDIAEDTSLPRPSSASAIRSNNTINPPLRQSAAPHDLGSLLAAVPSATAAPTDAFSIQSKTVFTREDFAQSYWASALTTNSGYVGLAVVAVTISVTHPLLFLAAALTALGTATAVGASYDYFMECAPCCTTSDATLQTADDTIVMTLPGAVTAPADPAAAATRTGNTNATAHGAPTMPTAMADSSVPTVPVSLAAVSTTTNQQQQQESRSLPPEWIDTHFPPLEFPVLQNSNLEGLNVVQFFDVFFSDTAPYNFREFQLQRGDKNVEYGPWTPVANGQAPLSMHPAAVVAPNVTPRSWVERELHFQAKTNNTFLGPPYATTTKQQRCWIWSKKMAVLEMKTTLRDIPFCDRFYVLERWMLTASKDDQGIYHLLISSTASVIFDKACPFTSQIQTKSRTSLTDVGRAWHHMAQQALLMAKQAKLDRLHQQEEDLEDEDDDETSPQNPTPVVMPEQAPSKSRDSLDLVEEKKEEDSMAVSFKDENVELMHSFTRQLSWVVGEEEPVQEDGREDQANDGLMMDGPSLRSRSLRRFLQRRPPRVSTPSSLGAARPKSNSRRLARESSAEF